MNDYVDIRARVAAATPGPWKIQTSPGGYPQRIVTDSALLIAETFLGPEYSPADAVFIAHARTDIPALLADRDALADEVARLRGNFAFTREMLEAERELTIRRATDIAAARARVADLEAQLAEAQTESSRRIERFRTGILEQGKFSDREHGLIGDLLARAAAIVEYSPDDGIHSPLSSS